MPSVFVTHKGQSFATVTQKSLFDQAGIYH